MKIMYISYLPIVILAILGITLYIIQYEKGYFDWVKKYFFLGRSLSSQISTILYITGLSLFIISLMDFRGPEQKVESSIPDQRTIIIIDSSASMLAEDVRPNRFQKSLLLARHFIKKAAGHQIAVVLFSDTQKRLVPFTDDIDLLDARVAGLSKVRIDNGGSNIRQAIAESLQYFKAQDSSIEKISGNLLVFTDSESNEETFDFKIPDSVNIALIGVGTARGAPIPIRNQHGVFRGYKKFNNEKVISKLDESFLKSFEKLAKNYKYWISTSFSIPTEKILDFFRNQHRNKLSRGLIRSRPVYAKYVLVPAILCCILAFLLNFKPSLRVIPCLLFFILSLTNVKGDEERKVDPLDKETLKLMSIMEKGKLDVTNKLKIAEGLFKSKRLEEAKILYDENLKFDPSKNHESQANYGTLLLAMGNIVAGAEVYQRIQSLEKVSDEIKKITRENLLIALAKQKKEQENKKKNKDKNKNDKNKQKDGEKSKQQNDDSENKKNGQQGEQDKDKDKNKNKEKNKEKDKKNKGKNNKKNKEKEKKMKKKKTIEEKEEEIRKKRKMVKIPAMLKQIMSDDSQLQQKYIDTSTRKKNSTQDKKDW